MKLSTQYGEFLGNIDWNYFSTLSFKWDVKQKQCEKVMHKLTDRLVEHFKDINIFWIAEYHKNMTSTHTHLLVRGDETIKMHINDYWRKNNLGDSKGIKHEVYNKSKGAHYYVSKYIDKNVKYGIY